MKYIGSKNRIIKYIKPIIQSYINENTVAYIEPFVGGANSIIEIECKKRIGIDIEPLVIALLKKVQQDLSWFDKLPNILDKEHYYEVKESDNYSLEYKAAILYFGSYNARLDGYYGAISKTKNDNVRNYFQEAKNNLIKQSKYLKDINFYNYDYKKLSKKINNCVIYCDPPYKNSYYKDKVYNNNGFDYEQYYNWCMDMSKNNIVLMSEYEMPNYFKCIWSKEHYTSMDNLNNKKSRIEKLYIVS